MAKDPGQAAWKCNREGLSREGRRAEKANLPPNPKEFQASPSELPLKAGLRSLECWVVDCQLSLRNLDLPVSSLKAQKAIPALPTKNVWQ